MPDDCIFCKIIAKEIPSTIVHETDTMLVMEDINPKAPIHLLILPKAHYATILDCDDRNIMADMMQTAQRVAKEKGVDEAGFRLIINTNQEGGQIVYHIHMHFLAGSQLGCEMA